MLFFLSRERGGDGRKVVSKKRRLVLRKNLVGGTFNRHPVLGALITGPASGALISVGTAVGEKKLSRKERRKLAQSLLNGEQISGPVASAPRKYRKDAEQKLETLLRQQSSEYAKHDFSPAVVLSRILSRMAYDAARSGTESQRMAIIELAISKLGAVAQSNAIRAGNSNDSRFAIVAAEGFYSISQSLFHFALAATLETRLFDLLLKHAATCLKAILSASFAQSQSGDIAKLLFDGLSSAAAGGIRTVDLEINGVLSLIRDLYQRFGWEHAYNPIRTNQPVEYKSDNIDKIREEIVLTTLMTKLYHELFAEGSDVVKSFWLHSSTGKPLSVLWYHSVKQRKLRVDVSNNNADSACSSLLNKENFSNGRKVAKRFAAGVKKAKLGVSKLGDVIWSGDSPLGFANMNAPLVVDVGCGFAVSLLGLAAGHQRNPTEHLNDSSFYSSNLPQGDVNFLGCDLSSHCVAFASAMSRRWGIDSKCRFCVAPAEPFLRWVLESYPGRVLWICIQFPTPYKLDSSITLQPEYLNSKNNPLSQVVYSSMKRRNVQLPGIEETNGFMVTPLLIALAIKIALKHNGFIFVQSNVEDVAVTMRSLFVEEINKLNDEDNGMDNSAEDRRPLKRLVGSRMKIQEELKSTEKAIGITAITNNDLSFTSLSGEKFESVTSISCEIKKKLLSRYPRGDEDGKKKLKRSIDENSTSDNLNDETLPNRKLIWKAVGGAAAEGEGWLVSSPFPLYSRTETETVYEIDAKPVYRFAWRANCLKLTS